MIVLVVMLMMKQKNILNLFDQPVSSVRERPGDDGVALLVIRVASLQLPLGRCGAVANAPG